MIKLSKKSHSGGATLKQVLAPLLLSSLVMFSGCGSDGSTPSDTKVDTKVDTTASDTTAPVFTSSNTVSVAENQIDVITLVATDANVITYSISGGDSADFNINSSSGIVTFKTAPNFETKQNYEFEAKATDSANHEATQALIIIVTDVDETTSAEPTDTGTITSPTTGRVWMDRNLGASQVCTASDDKACFGDYYQWGRAADGHEKSNSTPVSTIATTINPEHDDFIVMWTHYNGDNGGSDIIDWTSADYYGTKRASWNPCPSGFRIPTKTEIDAEAVGIANINEAYTKLKLPSAGSRHHFSGFLEGQGTDANIWASDTIIMDPISSSYALNLGLNAHGAIVYASPRASGLSVRCLKD